ncbi:MAG: MBOAT family O-acyltransferase [Candidatus Krumholzibacteriia bacterium]
MLFNSIVFLLFGALVFALWPLVRRWRNSRFAFLVIASFVFYGWWDWRFLFLIIGSGLLDYASGLGMSRFSRVKRLFLVLSLLGNVGSLMLFKYSGFFAANLEAVLGWIGLEVELRQGMPPFMLVLPVGISFYTFQSMSYTIDIYRGQLQPTRNVLHFFAYLALFPQLVAGPIIRAADLLPQLLEDRRTTAEDRWEGLRLVVHGFFKKMVVADSLAFYVNGAFGASIPAESSLYWWIIITAFAVQIYCDFSGYSDIARGLARWLGYDFMVNFKHPYVAVSLQDFWRRWHISLSTWFRDYVYIPLGGSQRGARRAQLNMWGTMLISGLWHGAAWNFVIWGGIHATSTTMERATRWPARVMALPGGRMLANAIVLLQVWISWVFFRATSFEQAVVILGRMFSFEGGIGTLWALLGGINMINLAIFIGGMWLREAYFFWGLHERPLLPGGWGRRLEPVGLALAIAACVYLRGPGGAFIYFQF